MSVRRVRWRVQSFEMFVWGKITEPAPRKFNENLKRISKNHKIPFDIPLQVDFWRLAAKQFFTEHKKKPSQRTCLWLQTITESVVFSQRELSSHWCSALVDIWGEIINNHFNIWKCSILWSSSSICSYRQPEKILSCSCLLIKTLSMGTERIWARVQHEFDFYDDYDDFIFIQVNKRDSLPFVATDPSTFSSSSSSSGISTHHCLAGESQQLLYTLSKQKAEMSHVLSENRSLT